MAGEHDRLREILSQLQAQLADAQPLSPAAAERLQSTIAEAQAILSGEPAPAAQHPSIINRLSDAVLKLEASHPTLATNLGSLIDALGQSGL